MIGRQGQGWFRIGRAALGSIALIGLMGVCGWNGDSGVAGTALAANPDPSAPVAAEPPPTPFLRIETGMHTAIINRISVDAAGRLAATASDDKTVRLWSLADGKLVTTLRVPIGPGPEGKLYAVALSPDGRMLATSGATGNQWDGRPALYLFDVESQRLKARLSNLPSEIVHLAYSPDGTRLAAVFGAGAGLVVYDMTNGRIVGEDHNYAGQSANWVAFDPSGRLATTALDGLVRLYDGSVRLVARQKLAGNNRPFSAAFSPDGGLLAVGSLDQPRVEVLSGFDLKPKFAPEVGGLRGGNLAAVSWLLDRSGLTLAAGGTAAGADGARVIRLWPGAGVGRPYDVPAAKDSINQIEALAGGDALFVSAAPSWGRISAGRVVMEKTSDIADFREVYQGRMAVSDDGLVVEFGIRGQGRRPMRLDLRLQSYGDAPLPDPSLAVPVTDSPFLKVSGWRNTQKPMLGERRLPLDGEERARSLAIAPDGRSFLLGSDFALSLFDARGQVIDRLAVPAAVNGVVIARSGQLAVAALADGTLRWYSFVPGYHALEERATVFAHADGQRWVAWTPEGFFDHADNGGKELVGYHFNKGKARTPEWVSFAQVYQLFHSSDLLRKKILGSYDAEIRESALAIGDLRARFEKRPLPQVDVTDYCWKPQPGAGETCRPIGEITTRGFKRDTAATPGALPGPATGPASGPVSGRVPPASGATDPTAVAAVLPPGSTELGLKVKVTDRGGGIGDVLVFLNNRNIDRQDATRAFRRDTQATAGPLAGPSATVTVPAGPASGPSAGPAPGKAAAGEVIERRVTLEPGANTIEVRVYDAAKSAYATSRRIEVIRPAPVPTPAAVTDRQPAPPAKPRLFVLAAGINKYKVSRLAYAVADAESFVQTLKARAGNLYDKVLVPTILPNQEIVFTDRSEGRLALADEQATRPMLSKAFAALAADHLVESGDTVVVYLAGHGVALTSADLVAAGAAGGAKPEAAVASGRSVYYFITQDVESPDTVAQQALSQDVLLDYLAPINRKTGNVLLFLDSCHSGALTSTTALDAIDKLNSDAGIGVLAAAAGDQEALDGYRPNGTGVARNGVFATAVINGLDGQAERNQRGEVSNSALGFFVKKQVPKLAHEVNPAHAQAARWRFLGEVEQFPLTRVAP